MIAAAVPPRNSHRSCRSSDGRASAHPQAQPTPHLKLSSTLKLPAFPHRHLLGHRIPLDQKAHSTNCHDQPGASQAKKTR
jgi:hypothetical protein